MIYPSDADGNVLELMAARGFDFSKPTEIDFNIDFDHWPISAEEFAVIKGEYPNAVAIEPDEVDMEEEGEKGYIQFTVIDILTYNLVKRVQSEASALTKSIGGVCESWGVLF